jgi:hypothetical protein
MPDIAENIGPGWGSLLRELIEMRCSKAITIEGAVLSLVPVRAG